MTVLVNPTNITINIETAVLSKMTNQTKQNKTFQATTHQIKPNTPDLLKQT